MKIQMLDLQMKNMTYFSRRFRVTRLYPEQWVFIVALDNIWETSETFRKKF